MAYDTVVLPSHAKGHLYCCSVEDLFAAIENDPEPSATKYLVRASYLQIYNEVRATLGFSTTGLLPVADYIPHDTCML